jgi:cytochrome bd-type quinol oxidase subunit 2
MRKALIATLVTITLAIGGSYIAAPMVAASAAGQVLTGVDSANTGATGSLKSNIKRITNVLLFILGAIAVIVIVIGGFMYATSAGDAQKAKTAKDMILYAAIGIVVAMLAFAIVQFVTTQF